MADYSRFLFDSLNGIGNVVTDNRRNARQDMEQDRSYSRALGLDAYGQQQDERGWQWKQQEATRDQRNADREYGLSSQRLAQGSGMRIPMGYRAKPDGSLEAIPGGPAAAGKTANAPVGYRWGRAASGEEVLEPIPGGPAEKIPGELSARVGMAENYLKGFEPTPESVAAGDPRSEKMDAIKGGAATGIWDYAKGKIGRGDAGVIHREISSGMDALQRMLTGAGMPQSEADAYARRYAPTMWDDGVTLENKVSRLNDELRSVSSQVQKGRTPAAQQGGNPGNPYEALTPQQPQGGLPEGVSEEDIQFTMQQHGLSREEVLQELGF